MQGWKKQTLIVLPSKEGLGMQGWKKQTLIVLPSPVL